MPYLNNTSLYNKNSFISVDKNINHLNAKSLSLGTTGTFGSSSTSVSGSFVLTLSGNGITPSTTNCKYQKLDNQVTINMNQLTIGTTGVTGSLQALLYTVPTSIYPTSSELYFPIVSNRTNNNPPVLFRFPNTINQGRIVLYGVSLNETLIIYPTSLTYLI